MHKATAVRLLVLALVGLCSACAYIDAYRPAWTYPPSHPQRTYYSSSRHRVRSARNRSASRESSPAASVDSAEPATEDRYGSTASAPAVASNPPGSLSLAGDSGDREKAERLLDDANANLVRARRQHLTAAEKETYERASQLASRARRALADNDCAAASSLASKASSLAAGISGD